ncbi:hypothetical protein [Adlercreutzia caecimuris]|uniref:Glycosyltransferase 2-like domain-containing protein n=1 Tax=Adlercreutzia caecimuris B7 TaxID=1235794 RepID=R9LAW3_9ACTN|nr:hypothetical protein [Adlercreutzia caecimuris]EOS52877.1 hypothetical protein C811_00160 [Adlercreutzia caecimuris B7]
MGGFKEIVRKVIPLRASVFEAYRKKQENRLDKIALSTTRLSKSVKQIEKQNQQIIEQNVALQKAVVRLAEELRIQSDSAKAEIVSQVDRATASICATTTSASESAVNLERLQGVKISTGFKSLEAKVNGLQKMVAQAAAEGSGSLLREWEELLTRGEGEGSQEGGAVVSLTSYPARIGTVHKAVESLMCQSVVPSRIELWLAVEQFPYGEAELPQPLLDLAGGQFVIRWCDDIKAHKKYFYALQEHPNSPIVTVDDDLWYASDTIEKLLEAHRLFPGAVCARRVKRIGFKPDGSIAPYREWPLCAVPLEPRTDLLATGVGGVLYPPGCMDDRVFDKELLMRVCPNSDDLWLKAMQFVKGTPTVLSDSGFEARHLEGTQETSLYIVDEVSHRNDYDIRRICEALR